METKLQLCLNRFSNHNCVMTLSYSHTLFVPSPNPGKTGVSNEHLTSQSSVLQQGPPLLHTVAALGSSHWSLHGTCCPPTKWYRLPGPHQSSGWSRPVGTPSPQSPLTQGLHHRESLLAGEHDYVWGWRGEDREDCFEENLLFGSVYCWTGRLIGSWYGTMARTVPK